MKILKCICSNGAAFFFFFAPILIASYMCHHLIDCSVPARRANKARWSPPSLCYAPPHTEGLTARPHSLTWLMVCHPIRPCAQPEHVERCSHQARWQISQHELSHSIMLKLSKYYYVLSDQWMICWSPPLLCLPSRWSGWVSVLSNWSDRISCHTFWCKCSQNQAGSRETWGRVESVTHNPSPTSVMFPLLFSPLCLLEMYMTPLLDCRLLLRCKRNLNLPCSFQLIDINSLWSCSWNI